MPNSNSAISRRFGAIRRGLPADVRPSCQITLSGQPEQRGLSKCVGLSLLRHAGPMYTEPAAAVAVLYVFLCPYLSSCLVLALSPRTRPRPPAPFSAPLTSRGVAALVLDSLEMTRRLVKMCD